MSTIYPKNWESEIVDKYITQESQEKSRREFEKTHVPINRIEVEENKVFDTWFDEEEGLVSEDIVLETVTDSSKNDSNRLFFVVGESGSGKSELCQWLDYQIQDEADEAGDGEFAHEPILIPRHIREPRDVVQLLTEDLDDWDFENAKYLSNLPFEGIYRKVTGEIINQFDKKQEATVDFLESDSFESEVHSNLNTYVDAFNDPDAGVSFEPIEKDDLATLLQKYPEVTREHENHATEPTEYLYKQIKKGATNAFSEMLSAGDIQEMLRDIEEAYQSRNRRPVLIIEDLTGFTVYDHEILSFFSDLQTAHFDVMIGVTVGPYQKLVDQRRADVKSQDTINDRLKAKLNLTKSAEDGSGSRTLFLEQEGIHIDLARKYLQAIKDDSDLDYDPDLPGALSPQDVDEAFGDALYPFNREFLDRIYSNLQEKNVTKQTPRVYLNFVISELLDNQNSPFEHAEKLKQRLGNIENRLDPEYQKPDEQILKWYGTDNGDHYTVDERIPHTFDIDSNGQAPTIGGPEEICPECGSGIYVSGDDWTCPDCGYSRIEETSDGPTLRQTFTEQRNELLAWIRGESDFDQTSNIVDGAQRIVTFFFDKPNSLRTPQCRSSDAAYLRWNKGSDRVPIHVRNSDVPTYTQIELTRDINQSVLTDLLRVGVWEDVTLADLERQNNIDLDRLREWAEESVTGLREDLETDIEDEYGANLDELAIFGKYLLNVFSGNGTEFTPEALAEPVSERNIHQVYSRTDFDGNVNSLASNFDTYEGLFHARFHLRRNVVDHNRLEEKMASLDRETLRQRVHSIEGEISGFKIGPTSSASIELDDFLKKESYNIRGFARDIGEYAGVFRDDLDATKNELTNIYQSVRGIGDELDLSRMNGAYKHLSSPPSDVIDDVEAIDDDKVDQFLSELSRAVERASNCDDVWEYLVVQRTAGNLKYKQWSDIYSTLSDFVDELETVERDLGYRIQELEDETFEPDKTPYHAVQTQCEGLAENLGGDL